MSDVIQELESRLERYPVERYPIQHATAQFHLGVALADAGDPASAAHALECAKSLFGRAGLIPERAKALNALGAARRLLGDPKGAERAFSEAASAFARNEMPLEEGAALFNLGLVVREREPADARDAFERAGRLLRRPREVAAAKRELGVTLLALGEVDAATELLAEAASLAERAEDQAGRGAALNALGLAHLAADRAEEAVAAFRGAVASHPRSVRPQEFAMVKANLALAYERLGATARARLAARQALDAPDPPPPVIAEAESLLARLGSGGGDLAVVLDEEEEPEVAIREEVVRWAALEPPRRQEQALEWIEAQLARPELAAPWLGALLELPPPAMEAVIASVLGALPLVPEAERFRENVERAMATFHTPQLLRLRESFEWS
jgi:tetratricopeptide (TPR) repeat protein